MYIFNKKELGYILGIPLENELESLNFITSNIGPAYLDKWTALEKEPEPWVNYQNISELQKPKIILCNPDLNLRAKHLPEYQIFSQLLKHCEIYLWKGDAVSMAQLNSVQNANELWENIEFMHPGSLMQVQRWLSIQGLTTKDYVILDYHQYASLLNRLYQVYAQYEEFYNLYYEATPRFADPQYFDLTNFKIEELNTYQHYISFDQITTVFAFELTEAVKEMIVKYFVNANTLILQTNADLLDISAEPGIEQIKHWIIYSENNLQTINCNHLQLMTLEVTGPSISSHEKKPDLNIYTKETIQLTSLKIKNYHCKLKGKFNLTQLQYLEYSLNQSNLNLSQLRELKYLKLNAFANTILYLPDTHNLEHLELYGESDFFTNNKLRIFLSVKHSLKTLIIEDITIDRLDLKNQLQLEHLELKLLNQNNIFGSSFSRSHPACIELPKANQKLKILKISGSYKNKDLHLPNVLKNYPNLCQIEFEDFNFSGEDFIFNLADLKKLEYLALSHCRIYFEDHFNISTLEKISFLKVKGCELVEPLFYKQFKKIEHYHGPLQIEHSSYLSLEQKKYIRSLLIETQTENNPIDFSEYPVLEMLHGNLNLPFSKFFQTALPNLKSLSIIEKTIYETDDISKTILAFCPSLEALNYYYYDYDALYGEIEKTKKLNLYQLPILFLKLQGNLDLNIQNCDQLIKAYIQTSISESENEPINIHCINLKSLETNLSLQQPLNLYGQPKLESLDLKINSSQSPITPLIRTTKADENLILNICNLIANPLPTLKFLNIKHNAKHDLIIPLEYLPFLTSLMFKGVFYPNQSIYRNELNLNIKVSPLRKIYICTPNEFFIPLFKPRDDWGVDEQQATIKNRFPVLGHVLCSVSNDAIIKHGLKYILHNKFFKVYPYHNPQTRKVLNSIPPILTPSLPQQVSITSDKRKLDQANAQTAVARVIFNQQSLPIDSNTGPTYKEFNFENDRDYVTFTFKNNREISRNFYRIHIYDRLEKHDSQFILGYANTLSELQPISLSSVGYQREEKISKEFLKIQKTKMQSLYNAEGMGYIKSSSIPFNTPIIFASTAPNQVPVHTFIELDLNIEIEFYKHPITLTYLFILKKTNSINHDIKNASLKLLFIFEQHEPFLNGQQKLHPLPLEIQIAVSQVIQHHPQLHVLRNSYVSKDQKLKLIIDYCKSYELKGKTNDENFNRLEDYINPIRDHQGSCRHRATSFFILSNYINVFTLLISNGEDHAFNEYALSDATIKQAKLTLIDLGGSPFALNLTDLRFRKNIFDHDRQKDSLPNQLAEKQNSPIGKMISSEEHLSSILANLFNSQVTLNQINPVTNLQQSSSLNPLNPNLDTKNKNLPVTVHSQNSQVVNAYPKPELSQHQKWFVFYKTLFQNFIKGYELNQWEMFFQKIKEIHFAPFLALENHQTPYQVSISLRAYLKPKNLIDGYLFIDHPSELNSYFTCYGYDENGHEITNEGPLKKLILEGGILLLNISHFTLQQLLKFRSIFADEKTLHQTPINKNVIVILVGQKGLISSRAILSRLSQWKISNELLKPPNSQLDLKSIDQVESENLFKSYQWREILYGNIFYQRNKRFIKSGPFILAIKNAESKVIQFIIENPPAIPGFKRWLHRVDAERSFIYNGQLLTISENFLITTKENIDKLSLGKNINLSRFNSALNQNEKRYKFYIGIHNWYELSQLLVIDNKSHHANDIFGDLLSFYNINEYVFYISTSIPESLWQQLLSKIQTDYSNKNFDFVALPNVNIENEIIPEIIKDENKINIEPTHYRIHLSSDLDYTVFNLKKTFVKKYASEEIHIIEVHPGSTSSDLLWATQSEPIFHFYSRSILNLLIEHNLLILKGELSLNFYYALIPFLNSEQKVYVNGEFKNIVGQLIWVAPLSCEKMLGAIPYYKNDAYHCLSYSHMFTDDEQSLLVKTEKFFSYLNALPKKGLGQPKLSLFSFQRIKNIIADLQNKSHQLHRHNPIKNWIAYDYPPHTEAYAYVNVVAKFIFAANDFSEVSYKKLYTLLKRYQNNIEHMIAEAPIQLMNCFRGKDLNDIVFSSGNRLFELEQGFPKLTFNTKGILQKIIISIINRTKVIFPPKNHTDINLNRFKKLLDSGNKIIAIKGRAGVGKTHAITITAAEEKNWIKLFYLDQIQEWLTAKSSDHENKPLALYIPEGNTFPNHVFNYLKPIVEEKGKIFISTLDQFFAFSPYHIIITDMNFEDFPNRQHHEFFSYYAKILYWKSDKFNFLKAWAEKAIKFVSLPELLFESTLQAILNVYKLVNIYSSPLLKPEDDLRDIEDFLNRFILNVKKQFRLKNDLTSEMLMQIIFRTSLNCFSYVIEPARLKEYQARLTEALKSQFKINHTMQLFVKPATNFINFDHGFQVPSEYDEVIQAIEESLELREYGADLPFSYKKGLLIEGETGEGKTALIEAVLKKNGFSQTAQEKNKRYVIIEMGDEKSQKALKEAEQNGYLVLANELNADQECEKLIGQALTGRDNMGRKVQNTQDSQKFHIISSQNPGYYQGCQPQAKSLLSRLSITFFASHTDSQLEKIANKKLQDVEKAQAYVKAYRVAQKQSPEHITMASFRALLK